MDFITVPAHDNDPDPIIEFVESKLARFDCPPKALYQIQVAIEEILVNIVSYAQLSEDEHIEVRCEVLDEPLRVVLQFLDGYVIKPKLFGNTLGVSGLLILAAIIVCGNMFGIVGILLAIPLAAILDFVFQEELLPSLKVIITDGTTETLLPLDSFSKEVSEPTASEPAGSEKTSGREGE